MNTPVVIAMAKSNVFDSISQRSTGRWSYTIRFSVLAAIASTTEIACLLQIILRQLRRVYLDGIGDLHAVQKHRASECPAGECPVAECWTSDARVVRTNGDLAGNTLIPSFVGVNPFFLYFPRDMWPTACGLAFLASPDNRCRL